MADDEHQNATYHSPKYFAAIPLSQPKYTTELMTESAPEFNVKHLRISKVEYFSGRNVVNNRHFQRYSSYLCEVKPSN